ncbi:Hypothetical protein PHPALM_14318 [Phytophthora palmivora]|uniref:Kaptin n=1 Tax=Phytophthora palmivora TaxID=4796 RepID=A0A2P4XUZ2_9STRA|nr:Hypothetical protein PHPALM_14318 [Phytophthora palmivora]
MRFHQRRFFAYPSGAPNLHTLSSVSSHSYTLVTTDRCVSILGYGDGGYSLHKLEVAALRTGNADVVASAAIERSATRQPQVAVAYALGDALFLQVFIPQLESLDSGEAAEASSCGKFELAAAPTCMFSVQASGTSGDVFYGVMVCCTDSVMAFGYIEDEKEISTPGPAVVCSRLDNEQFAAFFPEFATYSHTILAVDVFMSPEKDEGWIAFGCADGLVRVFHGQIHERCLGGPFKTKDLQLNGPVTSVALFPKRTATSGETDCMWCCNLLVSCAIGQAVVYEDLYGMFDGDVSGEVLMDSDTFDSIFAGISADIDLDGDVELLLGTDSQIMLAYKQGNEDTPSPSESSLTQRKWQRLSRSHWDLETFGAIYSLLWRDVNHDGVPELLIASSTGIYVYEADPVFVIEKLDRVLSALHTSS